MASQKYRAEYGISVERLYQYYGMRRGDRAWPRGYADNSPDSVNASVANCRGGLWIPFVLWYRDREVALHHLHHMDPATDSTFISGWTFPDFRSAENATIRHDAYQELLATLATDWHYYHTHGYCLESNWPGNRWVLDDLGLVYVGKMLHATTKDGEPVAIVANTAREEDIQACKVRLETLFPEGQWDEQARA